MKLIFTLMFLFAATFMLKAQVIFEDLDTLANFEGKFNPKLESYTGEDPSVKPNLEIVANPKKDAVNSSDNVFVFARIDDGNTYSHKSAIVFKFDKSYDQSFQNFIHLKCYSPDRGTCFRITYFLDDVMVKDDWKQTNIDCNGKWAYLAFNITEYGTYNKIRIETSDAWGSTATPGVVYIDDIELYNEKVAGYLPAFKDMVYNAIKTTKAPQIDGLDNDGCWKEATFAPIEKLNSGDGSGIGGEWAATWDEQYLYCIFRVTDDVLWKWSDANWAGWSGDGFQGYIDVLGRRLDSRIFGNLAGFDFSPNRESTAAVDAGKGYLTALGGFGDAGKSMALQGSTINGSNYTIEVAWPWIGLATGAGTEDMPDPASWVSSKVKAGLEIAIDFQLNDDDGSGRVNMLSWASEPKEPYGNSGTWGGLKLEGTTGISKSIVDAGARVFPTTTSSILNISMQNLKKIEIYDLTGKTVISKVSTTDNARLDVSSLNKGIYIVRMSNGLNDGVQKFVKE